MVVNVYSARANQFNAKEFLVQNVGVISSGGGSHEAVAPFFESVSNRNFHDRNRVGVRSRNSSGSRRGSARGPDRLQQQDASTAA